MFNSPIFEVVIGLVFVYLLYSLLITIIQELISTYFGFRSKILERAIFRMLEDTDKYSGQAESFKRLFMPRNDRKDKKAGRTAPVRNSAPANTAEPAGKEETEKKEPGALTAAFYGHPLIKFLGQDQHHSKPSYLNREIFSKVILDLLRGKDIKAGKEFRKLIEDSLDKKRIKWGTAGIPPETLSFLKSIWADSQGDLEKFKSLLENWFDETMERTTGWYKKNVQIVVICVSLIIAVLFNVDTIQIAIRLQKDPKLRTQVIQQADAFLKSHPDLDLELQQQKVKIAQHVDSMKIEKQQMSDSLKKVLEAQITRQNEQLKVIRDSLISAGNSLVKDDISKTSSLLGLGLRSIKWHNFRDAARSIAGWIITALAISLGAPFWFDLLNKLMKMRSSVQSSTGTDAKEKSTQPPPINRVG